MISSLASPVRETSLGPPLEDALGRAVDILACPGCGDELQRTSGRVACRGCGLEFEADGHLVRFVDRAGYAESFGLQWKTFSRVQLDSDSLRNSETRLRTETRLTPDDLRGKVVLEAGCGMGRFLDVVSRDGAALAVGLDLSAAVDAAAENLADRSNVLIAQGDIFRPPFQQQSFDVIYSIGVLHHTPSAERAFQALVPFLKPGGTIAISVYAWTVAPGVAWSLNLARRRILRRITRHLPKRFLMWWSRRAVPVFFALDRVPVLRYLRYAFPVMVYSHRPVEWSMLDTFDAFATELESRHEPREVMRWFHRAGLTQIELVDGPSGWVSVRGRVPLRQVER